MVSCTGSRIRQTLPIPAPRGSSWGATPSAPARSRILAVDDNCRNLDILRLILEDHFALETATSGERALALAPVFEPDLILLDIMMPGIDGYETCRRLRAEARLRGTKIIMVSAKAMVSERLEGYEAGADDYVTKPFDDEELLANRVHLRLRSVEEIDALKTDVLSLLCHETRTPLAGIIGPAELLSSDEPLDTETRKDLARILLEGATRLHALIEKVLVLAELKAGTRRFRPAPHDLAAILQEAMRTVRTRAEQKNVTVACAAAGPYPAMVDRGEVTGALVSILDNAVRVSPSGAPVEVTIAQDQERVRVTVADHGRGIPPRSCRVCSTSWRARTPDTSTARA